MKLIPLILLTSLAVGVKAQKFRQEQFPLPPQFQNAYPGFFSSDSPYLPPESNTPLPYYPMKNMNLPYPYLPPTGTKAPASYPTPYPFLISSSVVSNFDEDDDEDEGRIRMSTPHPPSQQKQNQTEHKGPQPQQQSNGPYIEKREMRELKATPRMNFANFPNPIDRIDVKLPMKFLPPPNPQTTQSLLNQPPQGSKRMIIDNRNDVSLDQVKAASFQGPNFLHAGPGPIFVSSTTEPAIPILRLSNEMDLDGSFSYEALGADQTHYMQHSRMENVGDKEEQVVEGSYSYVGDNGQTYTVHYIADANGFRASGDHLPVAPPIPEIIQRAVQYNLAEEAKKPPHLRNDGQWHDDGRDNEINNSNERQPQFAPPPRNLFTGRTPEAFSYSYSQGSQNPQNNNNLAAAASNQVVKTVEYTTEHPKAKLNNSPISPQITFLASQGAHVPAMNAPQNSISRMFTTEKTSMPQLVNYDASLKAQEHEEANKALWRWQYGINANNANNLSQNPNQNKDTISRSIGDHDEVMINFSDMTPEQYTQMMRSQLEPNHESLGVAEYTQHSQAQSVNQNNYPVTHQQQVSEYTQNNQGQSVNQNKYPVTNQQRVSEYTQNNQAQYVNQNNYPAHQQNVNQMQMRYQSQRVEQYQNQDNSNFKNYQSQPQQNLNSNQIPNKTLHESPPPVNQQVNQSPPPVNQAYHHQNQEKANSNNYPNNFIDNSNNRQGMNKEIMPQKTTDMKTEQQPQQAYPAFENYQKISSEAAPQIPPTEATATFAPTRPINNDNRQANANSNQHYHTTTKPFESRELSFNGKPKIITHKDFAFPTRFHTVTQDYNFEDEIEVYEPRKIKSLNVDPVKYNGNSQNDFADNNNKQSPSNNVNDFYIQHTQREEIVNSSPMPSYEKDVSPEPVYWHTTSAVEYETTTTSTQPPMSTIGPITGLKFTDFIVKDDSVEKEKHEFANSDFKPIIPEATRKIETTTTETSVEEIIQNNIFLKSFLNPQKTHINEKKNIEMMEEPKRIMPLSNILHAEPKTEKPIIFQAKPANEIKVPKKKLVDMADILNYVSMKNHFDVHKMKPKGKQTNNITQQKNEVRLIPIQQEKPKDGGFQESNHSQQNSNNYRNLNHDQQEELKGIIRNYKVLQRNNNNNANKYESSHIRTDLSPPPLKPMSLPPLGRAGPSMKSYLPPIYV